MKASLIVGVALTLPLWADTVELRTGEKLVCKYVLVNVDGVTVGLAGAVATLPLSKVKAIYFDPVDSSTSAPDFHKLPNSAPDSTPAKANPKREALLVLKALRSLTNVQVNQRDYNLKLADTEAKVDALLDDLKGDMNALLIKQIVSQYSLCSTQWGLTSHIIEGGLAPFKCWDEASKMIDNMDKDLK
jgi:hypothetical protein